MPAHRDFPPRLMSAPVAAHYLNVSESFLRTLPIPRRVIRSRRLFDKADLDAYADSLPYEGGEDARCAEVDAMFGLGK